MYWGVVWCLVEGSLLVWFGVKWVVWGGNSGWWVDLWVVLVGMWCLLGWVLFDLVGGGVGVIGWGEEGVVVLVGEDGMC